MRRLLPVALLLASCASMPVAEPHADEVVVTKTKRDGCEVVRDVIVGQAVADTKDHAIVGAVIDLRNVALGIGATHVFLLRTTVESAWSVGPWAFGSAMRATYEGR